MLSRQNVHDHLDGALAGAALENLDRRVIEQ